MKSPQHALLAAVAICVAALAAEPAAAMCGCMVGRPRGPQMTSTGTRISNEASKVILHRKGESTTLVMSNDFEGEVEEFALFVPVPVVVGKGDVAVLDKDPFAAFDRQSAPRVTTFIEPDPCWNRMRRPMSRGGGGAAKTESLGSAGPPRAEEENTPVVVKAEFAVGPFHVVVLSAEQSRSLVKWLRDGGYQVGDDATAIIDSYIKQGMYFFVAEVDAKAMKRTGRAFLPPLQVRFTSPRLGLPIRLGMLNASGPQELLVYTLADGRVEATNYRTVKATTEVEVPEIAARRANETYTSAFTTATAREGMNAIFMEYSGWTDGGGIAPGGAHLTRLHFRYDKDHFPEDLVLQVTADHAPFRVRYRARRPFNGNTSCPVMGAYRRASEKKLGAEIAAYAQLVGVNEDTVRAWMAAPR